MNEFRPLIELEARQRRQDVDKIARSGYAPWESRRRRLSRQLRTVTERLDS